MTTFLNIRIEEKTKKQAKETLSSIGLDLSTAIKIFLTQVIKEDGLPFTPTNNKELLKKRWDMQIAHAKEYGKSYKSGKEVWKDLW